MENLDIEELTQLVNFYRQRASDAELQLLQTQLKLNKLMADQMSKESDTKLSKSE